MPGQPGPCLALAGPSRATSTMITYLSWSVVLHVTGLPAIPLFQTGRLACLLLQQQCREVLWFHAAIVVS
jgi:hypothetical protein